MELAIWERFNAKCWPEHLNGAAAYFRCSSCRSSADVLLLPASREKAPPVPEDDEAIAGLLCRTLGRRGPKEVEA